MTRNKKINNNIEGILKECSTDSKTEIFSVMILFRILGFGHLPTITATFGTFWRIVVDEHFVHTAYKFVGNYAPLPVYIVISRPDVRPGIYSQSLPVKHDVPQDF